MSFVLWLPVLPIYAIARAAQIVADRRERATRNLLAHQAAVAACGRHHA